MSPGFSIRVGASEDVEALFEIHRASARELCRDHYTPAQLDAVMSGRTPAMYLPAIEAGRLLLACEQDKILGFIEVVPGQILRFFVHPGAAGKGVGAALMQRGLELAGRGHTGPIRIEATLNAQPFYERFGFRRTGTVFWTHGNEQAPPIELVIMESEQGAAGSRRVSK